MPYLRSLSSFRDGVRKVAVTANSEKDEQLRAQAQVQALKDILALCDKLRDVDLVPLGVALDDQEGGALHEDRSHVLLILTVKLPRRRQGSRETGITGGVDQSPGREASAGAG